ncbi:WD40/YVTN/BNR-like repeat-containing protein [Carnobacterium sp. TMP28]|uniref:WD40/YVTN/BNR-like repeat-containing protein n=1 Tax=Carnobacterium sp. TMP28 TaxID=3397060 RepID=UPI0039E1EEF7
MTNKNYNWRALVFNPLVVIVYGIGCYYLSLFAKYGGIRLRVPIILIIFLSLLLWFTGCLYWYMINRYEKKPKEKKPSYHLNRFSQFIFLLSVTSLILITLATGKSIYESGTHLNGRLAFVIDELVNKRTVLFKHDNVYQDGLDGLFEDLESSIDLPKELYIDNHFELTFNKKGEITSFYSFLYGLNDKSEKKTFLIDYDRSKSKKINVVLNGFTQSTFNETARLQPLIDGVKHLPIKETVNDWDEETLGIYYTGYRNWGYNDSSIRYFDKSGMTFPIKSTEEEVTGYTISIYTPNEPSITPIRFIDYSLIRSSLQEKVAIDTHETNEDETAFLSETVGYQLKVADAALGSRFYVLDQTIDGGETWVTINPDPFLGEIGISSGITFITKNLGFIGLSHSGSDYAELYRTADGGRTFEKLTFPAVEIPLNDAEEANPFDFPGIPYRENESLFLQIGQGENSDYHGGSQVLYQSDDDGKTWTYTAEIK